MKSTNPCCLGIVVLLAWVFAYLSDQAGAGLGPDKQQESLAAGKELFAREWLHGDKRSHAGDGLGPVFNARSCAACHHQGGLGGAGPKETNASVVSVFVQLNDGPKAIFGVQVDEQPDPAKPIKQPDRAKLAEIHPALCTQSSFPFHRFGTDKKHSKWKSEVFSQTFHVAIEEPELSQAMSASLMNLPAF